MRRFFLTCCVPVVMLLTSALVPVEQDYIDEYARLAVSEMYRSGVPASITLAQALVESSAGRSPLAVKGNNHFGIKCHNRWKGKTMRMNDDAPNECFRVYSSPEESYLDHSDFLRGNDRYGELFDLEITDYKGWARGLSKKGYATNPDYARMLIDKVEQYELYRFDKMKPSSFKAGGRDLFGKERRDEVLPASPSRLETPTKFTDPEVFKFSLSRPVLSKNGVPFVYSMEGETLDSIAQGADLFVKELMRFNDMAYKEALLPGTVIYLRPKKRAAVKGLEKFVVDTGDVSLRDLSQRYAVKLSSLAKMNGLEPDAVLHAGDIVSLRPEPRKRNAPSKMK